MRVKILRLPATEQKTFFNGFLVLSKARNMKHSESTHILYIAHILYKDYHVNGQCKNCRKCINLVNLELFSFGRIHLKNFSSVKKLENLILPII